MQEPLRVVTGRDIGVTQETGARSCMNLGERLNLVPDMSQTGHLCAGVTKEHTSF